MQPAPCDGQPGRDRTPHGAVPPPPPSPEFFPYKDGPFKLTMGLHALDPADWIQIDEHFAAEVAHKLELLAARHGEVFAARAGSEDAARECLELLADHLLARFPQWYRREGDTLQVLLSGHAYRLDDPALHPLDVAARLVQEDLCLMQADGQGAYRLTAASVCFPSRWKLSEKMGLDMRRIHAPVAFYEQELGDKSDRFLARMTADTPVWRLNWNVHDDPTLFQPGGHSRKTADPAITRANAGERLWLRVERQTLRRLPRTGEILFTIRTYRQALAGLRGHPRRAADLAGALRHMPPETFEYKSQGVFAAAALAWLDDVAGA